MAEARAQVELPLRAVEAPRPQIADAPDRLDRLHTYFVEGCGEDVRPALEAVLERAHAVRDGCGVGEVGDDLASVWYAASAVIERAAALELDAADIRGAAAAVAEACALPLPAARFVLFRETAGAHASSSFRRCSRSRSS